MSKEPRISRPRSANADPTTSNWRVRCVDLLVVAADPSRLSGRQIPGALLTPRWDPGQSPTRSVKSGRGATVTAYPCRRHRSAFARRAFFGHSQSAARIASPRPSVLVCGPFVSDRLSGRRTGCRRPAEVRARCLPQLAAAAKRAATRAATSAAANARECCEFFT